MQCLLLQDFDVQRAACLRGKKKNSSFKYESKANSSAKQCKQKREQLQGKLGQQWEVRQNSDPVRYGMTSQLRCVWASRTKKVPGKTA